MEQPKTSFIPFHAIVTEPSSSPTRYMLVLHGILGSGGNFRTFIKSVAKARPEWGFVLVDLRGHGQSLNPPPPYTVVSAAEDLVRLERSLGLNIRGVMGHSFGGKVALAYADLRKGELDELWILDSTPGVRPEGMNTVEAANVVSILEGLPKDLPSRERFFELLTARGLSRPTIEWLAMNVRREGDVFRFRLDLSVIRALLVDYFERDLFPVLGAPDGRRHDHVVLGGLSNTVGPDDRARLEALAAGSSGLDLDVLPRAGHWVHVDDPEGLLEIVRRRLS